MKESIRSIHVLVLIITLLIFSCIGCSGGGSNGGSSYSGGGSYSGTASPTPTPTGNIVTSDAVYHAPTNDRKYSYYHYIPSSALSRKSPIRVLFYCHGAPPLEVVGSNDYSSWESYVKNSEFPMIKPYCDTYGYALVIMVVPTLNSTTYPEYTMNTASMVRWVMFDNSFDSQITNSSFYKRPDLVFVKVIDEFTAYLTTSGYTPYSKVFMTGFSAGAMQTNRFSLMFPDKIAAAGIGAAGLYLFPLDIYNSTNLIYATGTSDIAQISGNTYTLSTYKSVPHFVYVGNDDTNDPMNGSNSATDEEKNIIRNNSALFGSSSSPTDRTQKFANYLQSIGMECTYKSYSGVGHQFTSDMINDTFKFFDSVTPRN